MADKIRLGDLLVSKGLISDGQLKEALTEQAKTGAKLGMALVNSGLISQEQLMQVLSDQLNIPIYDLSNYRPSDAVRGLLTEARARRFRALVIEDQGDAVLVAMADPLDITAIDELERVIPKQIKLAIVREEDLLQTLDLVYRRTDEISAFAEELSQEIDDELPIASIEQGAGAQDAPVIKLLQSVFEDAAQVGASDIHIEPDEKVLRIRLRVDGVLQEQIINNKTIARAIIVRLKLMSNLNIAETRLPQDGRFRIRVRGNLFDVRLSILPIQDGEAAVMRLLDQSGGLLNLDNVGMDDSMLKRFRKLFKSPHGIILVTGPTGSGKSTTLYGALSELNAVEKKIITVEDPVEYRLDRINQVQINDKINFSFAKVLRTTLRQDPDIIMVGEMRDQETAEIAIRAALTGHLVLSTLHTNDAASSASRLVDMDIDGFLVAATLRGVLAQRLMRRVCTRCSQVAKPDEDVKAWIESAIGEGSDLSKLALGKGCSYCNQTGYAGRIGIYELLELDFEMRNALRQGDAALFSDLADKALDKQLLLHKGLKLALEGVTTVEDVMRIAGG